MKLQLNDDRLELKTISEEDLKAIWQKAYNDNILWMEYDGPYFRDSVPTLDQFVNEIGPKSYVNKESRLAILYDGIIVGIVSSYFEDGSLNKWLEVGISIFDNSLWGKSIGYKVLKVWITYMFEKYTDIERVGFTTWSGNERMIRLGEKLGMTQEARIRKVRYYKEAFYDSIKFGVLREEWQLLSK